MKYPFSKYQGTGNDFIIFNGMDAALSFNREQIRFMCNRRFGIGADGVIILARSAKSDFLMKYYNADGPEGSMCGNGGRCIVNYAFRNRYISYETEFEAVDGVHKAGINPDNTEEVSLLMKNVSSIESGDNFAILDTGSPHYVCFVSNADEIDVIDEGRKIRYSDRFKSSGINVNFAERRNDELYIRTYERGVEDETLSCGTGVTAVALAAAASGQNHSNGECKIATPGGKLRVKFRREGNAFTDIYLTGPARFVFEGEIDL